KPLVRPSDRKLSFWKMAHRLGAMSESDRIRSIKSGFDVDMADATKQTFGLTSQHIGTLLNLSVATFERRRKAAKPLDMVASERLDRIANIALLAEVVFEDEKIASDWLSAPNPALNGN